MNKYSSINIFKILSDPARVRILRVLDNKKESCVGSIASAVGLSLSATSHQLRKLELQGIVRGCRRGREICYCINENSRISRSTFYILKAANKFSTYNI